MANALRSMPAQKPRPAPVSTPAVRPSSPSSCSTARSRPWARSVLMAFIASGRLSVMSRTRPRVSVRTAFSASDIGGRRYAAAAVGRSAPASTGRDRRRRHSVDADVHRDRRGVGPRRAPRGIADPDRAARPCSTTSSSAPRSPSTAAASPSSPSTRDGWDADMSDETLKRTSLGDLQPGDEVNLERPVRLSDRLGGHLVQGHVDGVGEIVAGAARPARALRPGPPALRRREGLDHGRRDQPDDRRRARRRVHGRRHPAHDRGDEPAHARVRAPASTWRST